MTEEAKQLAEQVLQRIDSLADKAGGAAGYSFEKPVELEKTRGAMGLIAWGCAVVVAILAYALFVVLLGGLPKDPLVNEAARREWRELRFGLSAFAAAALGLFILTAIYKAHLAALSYVAPEGLVIEKACFTW